MYVYVYVYRFIPWAPGELAMQNTAPECRKRAVTVYDKVSQIWV